MSGSTPLDLAALDAWHGVRPGMTRAQALEIFRQNGVDPAEHGTRTVTASTEDWEMECHFTADGSERLQQLLIEYEEVLWGGKPLTMVRLDEAITALGSPASTRWEPAGEANAPSSDDEAPSLRPVSDEELLENGNLWLPERGLGLLLNEGEVIGVAWCDAPDLPEHLAGPLTPAQLALSRRPDLQLHLRQKARERLKLGRANDPLRPLRVLLTLAAAAALGYVAWQGVQEKLLWDQAPTLTGKLVAIERVPMKLFRDFLPPALAWVVPTSAPRLTDGWRVEYLDPAEQRREVILEAGEMYMPPREAGAEVPVAFVAGDPPRAKGLARARDSAFVDYVPWAIAIGIIYVLGLFALKVLGRFLGPILQAARKAVPQATTVDPDRPELR